MSKLAHYSIAALLGSSLLLSGAVVTPNAYAGAAVAIAIMSAGSSHTAHRSNDPARRSLISLDSLQSDGTAVVSASAKEESQLPSRFDMELVCFSRSVEMVLSKDGQFELVSFVYDPAVFEDNNTLLQDTKIQMTNGKDTLKLLELKLLDLRTRESAKAVAFPWFEEELTTNKSKSGETVVKKAICRVRQLTLLP